MISYRNVLYPILHQLPFSYSLFRPKKKVIYTGPLRREDGPKAKKKKPLSQAQKESMRMTADAKWDRERYGMKSYVNYKDEDR